MPSPDPANKLSPSAGLDQPISARTDIQAHSPRCSDIAVKVLGRLIPTADCADLTAMIVYCEANQVLSRVLTMIGNIEPIPEKSARLSAKELFTLLDSQLAENKALFAKDISPIALSLRWEILFESRFTPEVSDKNREFVTTLAACALAVEQLRQQKLAPDPDEVPEFEIDYDVDEPEKSVLEISFPPPQSTRAIRQMISDFLLSAIANVRKVDRWLGTGWDQVRRDARGNIADDGVLGFEKAFFEKTQENQFCGDFALDNLASGLEEMAAQSNHYANVYEIVRARNSKDGRRMVRGRAGEGHHVVRVEGAGIAFLEAALGISFLK